VSPSEIFLREFEVAGSGNLSVAGACVPYAKIQSQVRAFLAASRGGAAAVRATATTSNWRRKKMRPRTRLRAPSFGINMLPRSPLVSHRTACRWSFWQPHLRSLSRSQKIRGRLGGSPDPLGPLSREATRNALAHIFAPSGARRGCKSLNPVTPPQQHNFLRGEFA
jgi:hypothetical protein